MTYDDEGEQDQSPIQLRRRHLGYGDGRDPMVKHATLFPSEEAIVLGKKASASAFAFFSDARHPIINSDTDWLEDELAYIADEYIRQRHYAALPSSDEYRAYSIKVGSAVRALLEQLEAGRDKSWGLDRGTRRELKLRLWRESRLPRGSIEEILRGFETVCNDFAAVRSSTAKRPRDDLRIAVDGIAGVWERLTGRHCPKNLEIDELEGTRSFQAEGPRFVHVVAIAFDSTIELPEIVTALRKRRVKKQRTQASPTC